MPVETRSSSNITRYQHEGAIERNSIKRENETAESGRSRIPPQEKNIEMPLTINKDYVFDGTGFTTWKTYITWQLEGDELLETLTTKIESGNKDLKKNDVKARNFVAAHLHKDVLTKVSTCETASELWSKLLTVYESANPINLTRLHKEFFAYKMDENDDISAHVAKVDNMALQLKQLGKPVDEEAIKAKILDGLPDEYSGFETAWDSVAPERQTMQELVQRLLKEEMRIKATKTKQQTLAIAFATDGRPNRSDRLDPKDFASKEEFISALKKRTSCKICRKKGHWANECRQNSTESKDREETVAFVVTSQQSEILSTEEQKREWFVDSAANRHICNNGSAFTEFKPMKSTVKTGNESESTVLGSGTVELSCVVNGKTSRISLKNVLYVPMFKRNLISVPEADSKGVSTLIARGKCTMKYGGRTVAVASKSSMSNLFLLHGTSSVNEVNLSEVRRSLQEWHATLGHASKSTITNMEKNSAVEGLKITQASDTVCTICPAAKGTRAPHNLAPSTQATQVGDVVQIDLIGPVAEESLGKNRYAMLAIDKHSKYSHVKLLKNKGECAEALQHYIGEFEVESGKRILPSSRLTMAQSSPTNK